MQTGGAHFSVQGDEAFLIGLNLYVKIYLMLPRRWCILMEVETNMKDCTLYVT
jgi:hypothetical protein